VAIGTVAAPEPLTGLAANFSPSPRIAPPPLGREIEGAAKAEDLSTESLLLTARFPWPSVPIALPPFCVVWSDIAAPKTLERQDNPSTLIGSLTCSYFESLLSGSHLVMMKIRATRRKPIIYLNLDQTIVRRRGGGLNTIRRFNYG
jgi:hypothetical protein